MHRTRRRAAAAAVAALTTVAATVAADPAAADPGRPAAPPVAPAAVDLPAERHGPRDADNRAGTVQPTDKQQSAAGAGGMLRWNRLGTPQSLTPVPTSRMMGGGLSGDPETAARQYLAENPDLFGMAAGSVSTMDTLLVRPLGAGTVVLLRQRFGDLPAGFDGLVSVLVAAREVVHLTSSLSRDVRAPEPVTLSAPQAVAVALADAGVAAADVPAAEVRAVAVPTPLEGPRAAWAVSFGTAATDDPAAYTSYVDGRTGAVLVREDEVDFDADDPRWAVFPATPAPGSSADTRQLWCATPVEGCARTVVDPVTGQAWDLDLPTGLPTMTSSGNSALDVVPWGAGTPPVPATPRGDRDYRYPFTDRWRQARCNPAVFQPGPGGAANDTDAAVSNLFAMHNRMHDWTFRLGFTEATWNMQLVNVSGAGLGNDAEQGRAQSGGLSGSRNNANQNTGRDGLPPASNMFLWQPIAGQSYPPCVDGDFDMTVIGHEYTHAVTNRMIAGPNSGIGAAQGGAMGESWGDLMAMEYLAEYGLRPPGDTPSVTGGYVTGNTAQGIRNYDMGRSALNYSDVGYDIVGPQVHADGEIWSATNYRIRQAFLQRYGQGTPALQERCADGLVPVDACPGNRRWAQLVFDSFLLQAASQVSMLDMRDNMLAADQVRFGGADRDLLWNAFARSGMGVDAVSTPNDSDPVPSFASPAAQNATLTLRATGDSAGAPLRLYVGDYEARAVPVADTDPATDLPDTFRIVGGQDYSFVAAGPGFGLRRFVRHVPAGQTQEVPLDLPRNVVEGGTFSGDGVNLDKLGDGTEATNWAALDGVAGKRITVDLPGDSARTVGRISLSAMLRPQVPSDVDGRPQNRFSALRAFTVSACDATVADCRSPGNFREVYRSADDAFPGGAFRPSVTQLNLRSFTFAPTRATHLRIEVRSSQCTGNPRYAGEQDDDPRAGTDCATSSPFASQVRIAEFQAFDR